MDLTESQRHRIASKLTPILGEEDAELVSEGLAASDLARRSDMHARFDLVDARFDLVDARFDLVDARFDAVEARFDAKLERCMREQMNRFVVVQVALMTALLTAQQLLGR